MSDTFRRACLVVAVVIGCVFSAIEILHEVRVPVRLLPGVAARVNGQSIDADSVNRTVAGLDARDRRTGTRRDVLSRMIDEELLVQHALTSGAAETSPEVRAALVRSAITRVNAETAAEPISDSELAKYFEAHREAYATSARFDVTPLYFESGTFPNLGAAQNRATAAREHLRAGWTLHQVLHTADDVPFAHPHQLITARTFANYFGPVSADLVSQVTPGNTTEAIPLSRGVVIFYLNQKVAAEVPSLASVHDLVLADAMRDRQEHALETLLTSLRESAHIEYSNSSASTAAVLQGFPQHE
jgi:PPIC-type PPIASE domain